MTDLPYSVTYYPEPGYECAEVYFDLYYVDSEGVRHLCDSAMVTYAHVLPVGFTVESCNDTVPFGDSEWFDAVRMGLICPFNGCPPYYVQKKMLDDEEAEWETVGTIPLGQSSLEIICQLYGICCPELPLFKYRVIDSKGNISPATYTPPYKYCAFCDTSGIQINASSTVLNINETSVLTVNFSDKQKEHCLGSVSWELTGDGSLEVFNDGEYAVYTAPGSNADCNADANISLKLCDIEVDTVHITITTGSGIAVKHYVYWGCVKSYTYECVNRFHYIYCSGYEQIGSIREFCVYGSFGICSPPKGFDCSTVCYENDYYRDVRTADAIAAGCCPPQLGY